jgi:diacylglycerol kinase (ATP)
MSPGVCVIVNPAAGRGRGGRALAEIRKTFALHGVNDVRVTTAQLEETTLARRAIDQGFTTLVAAGGDGTWSNVGRAILDSGADCRLGLLAAGTGNDFAKTVRAPAHDIAATARLALEGPDLKIDVGRVEDRYFLNVSGFGFDIAVLEDVGRIPWLQGSALYLYSALRQLLAYPGLSIEVDSPRQSRAPARHLMLIVANAQCFGGSFRIAPEASLTDGRLDAISIHDAPRLRRLRLLGAAARGTHTSLAEVTTEQASRFVLRFPEPPGYETDGEYHRAASATLEVTCVPRALRVVTPIANDSSRPAATTPLEASART